jgi:hypothetical protein
MKFYQPKPGESVRILAPPEPHIFKHYIKAPTKPDIAGANARALCGPHSEGVHPVFAHGYKRIIRFMPAVELEPLTPKRLHKKKRWMSNQYHERIQKKWSKRFGFETDKIKGEPKVLSVSPALYAKVQKLVESASSQT